MTIRLMGTTTIKIQDTTVDLIQDLCDFIYEKTQIECDWFRHNPPTAERGTFSIVCTQLTTAKYYPSNHEEPDDIDYEFKYNERAYRKLITEFEEKNSVELDALVSDLEVEEV